MDSWKKTSIFFEETHILCVDKAVTLLFTMYTNTVLSESKSKSITVQFHKRNKCDADIMKKMLERCNKHTNRFVPTFFSKILDIIALVVYFMYMVFQNMWVWIQKWTHYTKIRTKIYINRCSVWLYFSVATIFVF